MQLQGEWEWFIWNSFYVVMLFGCLLIIWHIVFAILEVKTVWSVLHGQREPRGELWLCWSAGLELRPSCSQEHHSRDTAHFVKV